MKNKRIDSNQLSFVCPMKRSEFQSANGEYFCDRCQKQVFDLTNCTLDEVAAIQNRQGSICGIVRAVSVASTLSLASCGSGPAHSPNGSEPTVVGYVMPPLPESVLGQKKDEAAVAEVALPSNSSEQADEIQND